MPKIKFTKKQEIKIKVSSLVMQTTIHSASTTQHSTNQFGPISNGDSGRCKGKHRGRCSLIVTDVASHIKFW